MPLYPVNLKISDRLCLVIGGGPVAARKVVSLLFCGARVRVISPEAVAEIRQLAETGKIDWRQRAYCQGDLQEVFLAIAATDHPEVQHQIAEEAAGLPVLLNSADDPAACDFQVPSKLRRGELLITISTGGASPALAKQIRKRLELEFGWEYGPVVALLARLRQLVLQGSNTTDDRSKLFNTMLGFDIAESVRNADWASLEKALVQVLPERVDSGEILRECISVANKKEF